MSSPAPVVVEQSGDEPYSVRWARQRRQARDAASGPWGPDHRPTIVVVAQTQSTWGALATICEELARQSAVELVVVAVDSEHDVRAGSTADFVRGQGYEPRDVTWFVSEVERERSRIALVVFDNPYDALRPEPLRSTWLEQRGVRMAFSPYGNNLAAGPQISTMLYDYPLQRKAWRIFARSEGQRRLYARHCAAGDSHVRVVGLPKLDRVVRLASADGGPPNPYETLAAGRPVVLWNPHFTLGPGGWSTFDRYLVPMLRYASEHPDLMLLVRPHFRLLGDLRSAGPPVDALADHLVEQVARHDNIVLDAQADYLPAFAASTAMISDLSSLIAEYVPTGRPVLYLHRPDGPGLNEDSDYVLSLEVVTTWGGVRGFLESVREGCDPGAERRRLAIARHFTHLDGLSGHRAAVELVQSLIRELPAAG